MPRVRRHTVRTESGNDDKDWSRTNPDQSEPQAKSRRQSDERCSNDGSTQMPALGSQGSRMLLACSFESSPSASKKGGNHRVYQVEGVVW